MYKIIRAITLLLIFGSCASKKDILYFQDNEDHKSSPIEYMGTMIQPNDILSITIGARVAEAAIPYNIQPVGNNMSNIETIRLQGYLVSSQGSIVFPVLGKVLVVNKTTLALEEELQKLLETGGHLIDPTVSIRILNAKVTILGEVNKPGTYSFTEQSLTVPQALGYAGDLTINGERKDILLIRESQGIRTIKHIDLTSVNWMTDPAFTIRQNDVLVINPNNTKVKSSGFIGNTSTILTIASLVLSSIVLLTR